MKNKTLLLIVSSMTVLGCVKAAQPSTKYKNIKGGQKFILTTGSNEYLQKDTVEVIGFIEEYVLVKCSNGAQNLHNVEYFKSHTKSLNK